MNLAVIRVQIAKDQGWHSFRLGLVSGKPRAKHGPSTSLRPIPAYGTDLNAIQRAALERFKTPKEQARFHDEIQDVCAIRNVYPWQLTAAEVSQAYLRAIGNLKS